MNTKRSVTWGLLAGAGACVAIAAMPGCELLVDFDRSKIPTGDASFGDDVAESPDAPASPDAAGDGSTQATEAGPDATAPLDAAVDSGDSSAPPPDTGTVDTGADAPNEVGTGVDSGPDAIADAGIDGD
jgi:hypothetical protein